MKKQYNNSKTWYEELAEYFMYLEKNKNIKKSIELETSNIFVNFKTISDINLRDSNNVEITLDGGGEILLKLRNIKKVASYTRGSDSLTSNLMLKNINDYTLEINSYNAVALLLEDNTVLCILCD